MNNQITSTLVTGLLIPILPAIAGFVIAYLRKKTAEITGRIRNDTLSKYIQLGENIIESCVTAVTQTYVDSLKKNGSFDKAAQAEALEMCKQKVYSLFSEDMKLALSGIYGDLGTYIDTKVEYYVNAKKSSPTTIVAGSSSVQT